MGMVNGGWRVDQQDKDHHLMFPRPTEITSMMPDRQYEDCWGPDLEYQVQDDSNEKNSLVLAATQRRVVTNTDKRTLTLDCK